MTAARQESVSPRLRAGPIIRPPFHKSLVRRSTVLTLVLLSAIMESVLSGTGALWSGWFMQCTSRMGRIVPSHGFPFRKVLIRLTGRCPRVTS